MDLGDDIEGFVPSSHSGIEDANRLEEYYGEGDPVSLRVIESDAANRRIVLEVTEVPERKSQEEIDALRRARDGGDAEGEAESAEPVAEPAAEKAQAEEPEAETQAKADDAAQADADADEGAEADEDEKEG